VTWLHTCVDRSLTRRRYGSGDQRRGAIKNRVSIDERPPIVAEKTRIGDWEGDLVIGKDQQGALVTLADRVSRYTLAGLVKSKHAEGVTAVIQSLFEPYRETPHEVFFGQPSTWSVSALNVALRM